jgi:hypothetical protein
LPGGVYLGSSSNLSLDPATRFTAPNRSEMSNSRHNATVIFDKNILLYTPFISEFHIKILPVVNIGKISFQIPVVYTL